MDLEERRCGAATAIGEDRRVAPLAAPRAPAALQRRSSGAAAAPLAILAYVILP